MADINHSDRIYVLLHKGFEMESINKEIQSILNKANAQGSLCSSATANGIMKAVKPFYGDINNANFIIQKIEALKSEPGIPFPTNYRELLSQ